MARWASMGLPPGVKTKATLGRGGWLKHIYVLFI